MSQDQTMRESISTGKCHLEEARRGALDCALSLARAMQDAGGSIPDAGELAKMTVEEFITKIAAQNNIRFIYQEPKKGQQS